MIASGNHTATHHSEPKDLGTDSAVKATKECLGAGWMGVGYPTKDADLETVDRFDAGRIHYNTY